MSNIQEAYVEETPLPVVDDIKEQSTTVEDILNNVPKEVLESYIRSKELTLDADELNQLRYLEVLSEDVLLSIGRLEAEKAELLAKLNVLSREKSQCVREIGLRHKIPQNSNWHVDLNGGKINIKDEPTE